MILALNIPIYQICCPAGCAMSNPNLRSKIPVIDLSHWLHTWLRVLEYRVSKSRHNKINDARHKLVTCRSPCTIFWGVLAQ